MGVVLIVAVGVAWILIFEPKWVTNHWNHWLFGDFFDDEKEDKDE